MDLNSETNSNDIYKNKDFAIQIIRVISMLFIIICHLCDYSNNPYISSLGQFFNIGVFIFLFISGFLYGSKKIDNNKKWLFHRLKKIMVPVYVFVCFFILFNFILTKFLNLNYFFIYLLDLQYFFGSMPNIGHLWFCTIIMICYLLLPLMNKYKQKLISHFYFFSIVIVIISIVIGLFNKIYGLLGFYLITFYIGYFFKNSINILKVKYIIPVVLMILGLFIRLIGKFFFDNTLFYETTITALTHIMITIGIFIFIYKLFNKIRVSKKMNHIINFFDGLSYYIYIVHYIFIFGPISVMTITNNIFFNILFLLFLTSLFAYLLKKITEILSIKI